MSNYGGGSDIDYALQSAREQAETDLVAKQRQYEDCLRNGDTNAAGACLRDLAILRQNYQAVGGQTQQGPQFTAREQQWLAQRPTLQNDPRRLREIGQVANQLIAAGYQRDSDAFYQALNMRVDKKNTDTDLPTPDEAVGITMARSKYSDPDGGKNVNEYNRGVHRLNYEKSLGNYKE